MGNFSEGSKGSSNIIVKTTDAIGNAIESFVNMFRGTDDLNVSDRVETQELKISDKSTVEVGKDTVTLNGREIEVVKLPDWLQPENFNGTVDSTVFTYDEALKDYLNSLDFKEGNISETEYNAHNEGMTVEEYEKMVEEYDREYDEYREQLYEDYDPVAEAIEQELEQDMREWDMNDPEYREWHDNVDDEGYNPSIEELESKYEEVYGEEAFWPSVNEDTSFDVPNQDNPETDKESYDSNVIDLQEYKVSQDPEPEQTGGGLYMTGEEFEDRIKMNESEAEQRGQVVDFEEAKQMKEDRDSDN